MKSFLIKSSLIIGIIILFIVMSGTALAIYDPLRPGNILFPLQNFAEQQSKKIYRDPVTCSSIMLDLVERRIYDLNARIGSKYEAISLRYLDKAIDQATLAISLVPTDKVEPLRERLFSLAKRAYEVQNQLKLVPIEENVTYIAFQSKVLALLQNGTAVAATNNGQILVPVVTPNTPMPQVGANIPVVAFSSVSGLIPFPSGSRGAVHAFYTLVGQHTTLVCDSCHNSGKYVGTPNTCVLCHLVKLPNPHYPGDCELCHTPVSWKDIHFDHTSAAATDCSFCHEKDKPANHYNGKCSACHVSQAWNIVTFDHAAAGAVDCISCHTKDEPANHYPGQCSNCHDPNSAWKNAKFNHSGFTDCISCHAGIAPANHYGGQCSNCHDSSSTWQNAHFNHSGFTDCISCHAGNAPANHYAGQCSNCHDPNSTWKNAQFNHSGYTDCISCHAGNAPANHYSGQCSNCHTTSTWSGATFNHNGLSDCSSCHSGSAPPNHFPYQCSLCHNTSSWGGANFDHGSGPTDCISCHLKDRPSEHDTGQCSKCHNTQGWGGGGANSGFNFINNSILQTINCSDCHSNNVKVSINELNQ
jgi:hypothetical protein